MPLSVVFTSRRAAIWARGPHSNLAPSDCRTRPAGPRLGESPHGQAAEAYSQADHRASRTGGRGLAAVLADARVLLENSGLTDDVVDRGASYLRLRQPSSGISGRFYKDDPATAVLDCNIVRHRATPLAPALEAGQQTPVNAANLWHRRHLTLRVNLVRSPNGRALIPDLRSKS